MANGNTYICCPQCSAPLIFEDVNTGSFVATVREDDLIEDVDGVHWDLDWRAHVVACTQCDTEVSPSDAYDERYRKHLGMTPEQYYP